MRVTITKKAEKKLRQGFPLVQKEDLVDSDFPTDWVIFQTQRKEEIARGYLAKQRRRLGTDAKKGRAR